MTCSRIRIGLPIIVRDLKRDYKIVSDGIYGTAICIGNKRIGEVEKHLVEINFNDLVTCSVPAVFERIKEKLQTIEDSFNSLYSKDYTCYQLSDWTIDSEGFMGFNGIRVIVLKRYIKFIPNSEIIKIKNQLLGEPSKDSSRETKKNSDTGKKSFINLDDFIIDLKKFLVNKVYEGRYSEGLKEPHFLLDDINEFVSLSKGGNKF